MKIVIAILVCALAAFGCGSPRETTPGTPPFLLDSTLDVPEDVGAIISLPGFQPAVTEIAEMRYSNPSSGLEETGMEIVLDLLENEYGQDVDVPNGQQLDERLANVPEYPERTLLLRVTQSIWVERQHAVPWSLADNTEAEVRTLFYLSRKGDWPLTEETWLNDLGSEIDLTELNGHWYPEQHIEQESSYAMVAVASKLLGATPEETLLEAIRWSKSNFFHAYNTQDVSYGHERYRDGRTDADKGKLLVFYPLTLERLFEERIGGCQEPSLMIAAILRSLNIPVLSISLRGHGAVYVPSMDVFIHGDPLSMNQRLAAEDFLLPIAWTRDDVAADPLMSAHLAQKVIDRYGDNKLLLNGPQIRRDEISLLFPYTWDIGEDIMAVWQLEFPQYNVHYVDNNGVRGTAADPAPLRSLLNLSSPKTSVW